MQKVTEHIQKLLQQLQDGDEWQAIEAAEALGDVASPLAVSALLETLQSKAWCTEIDSLIRDGDTRKTANLSHLAVATVQLARDINALRAASAIALGKIGAAEAVPGLIEAMLDEHMTAPKKEAAQALRQIGTADALQALTSC